MNLRSVALQCPLIAKPSVKPHCNFMIYTKSIKCSKQLRLDLYPSVSGESNTVKYYSNKLNLDLAQINLKFFDKVGRKNYIPERLKNFIFKFNRNRLKLGAQLSHFTQVERNCTHCATLHNLTIPETCSHVFFECEFYKELFTNTLSHYFDDYNFLNNPTKAAPRLLYRKCKLKFPNHSGSLRRFLYILLLHLEKEKMSPFSLHQSST